MGSSINSISFIGAGAMAESIIKGLLKKNMLPAEHIRVTNRTNDHRLEYLSRTYGIQVSRSFKRTVQSTDLIILVVKPKDATDGLQRLRPLVSENQLIVSVMAGITTAFIESVLNQPCSIIRTMPNTSSEIGMSATTLCTGKYVTSKQIQAVKQLFTSIGSVTTVNEQVMGCTTAIAGSGPAYLYYIAEAMNEAARTLNLSEKDARVLIADTLIGAGHMLKQTTQDMAHLRKNITSAGGTTAAGLDTLMKRQVDDAFKQCIYRASQRAAELQMQYSTETNIQKDKEEPKASFPQ